MRLTPAPLALTLAAALAACSESAAPGTGAAELDRTALEGQLVPTGRHIVLFSGPPSAGFSQQVEALGGRVDWAAAGIATLSGLDAADSDRLARRKEVRLIVADVALSLDLPEEGVALEAVAAELPQAPATPNTSFFYARQWNMRAVGADLVWAAGHLGSPSVTTFILDTGIDYLYPDLAGRVDPARSVDLLGTFQTLDTIGGVPTFIDFTEGDSVAKYFPTRAAYTDLYFHGTHVGATVSSNALVTAGVTSGTRLAAVKVCGYINSCPFSSVLNGVIYAAEHGADVINLSLGGGLHKAGNGRFAAFINQVFTYARSQGATIVVAAGNSGADLDHNGAVLATYCDIPGVICVSATGPTTQAGVNGPWANVDASSSFTNYGRSAIDLAAPGGNLNALPAPNTFVYAGCSQTSLIIPICQTGFFAIGAAGTSMSAPHVAGTAALLVSELGRSPAMIAARLQKTADDLGQPGTDTRYGRGRLNVARALGVIP